VDKYESEISEEIRVESKFLQTLMHQLGSYGIQVITPKVETVNKRVKGTMTYVRNSFLNL
jgi:hypothetical protein